MNKRVLNLIILFAFLFLSATAYSQAVTMTTATGGLAGAAQLGGTSDIAIIGVQLNKGTGGGNTVTNITVGMTPTPVGKFTNARLYESADATFAGIGSETFVGNGIISATDISFTGAPLTNFDGAVAAADDEFFFVVVDVSPTVASAATTAPSLPSTGVAVSTGSASGTTITGATYTFTALEADFSQNADDPIAFADEDDVTLLDFTVNSSGTQSVNSTLTFTFNTDVTNILENFDLQVGGVNVAGAETYPLTGGGTILTVTGFTAVDVTNATIFTLLADIKGGATSANDFTVNLVPGGVSISTGLVETFGTFSNPVDVTGLEADFTQNADDATAVGDEDDVTLLDFSVNSSGTQSVNSTLTFTFNTDVTNILENFDLQVDGVNIGGAETYPLTGGGTILTVTGFTAVDVTNATIFTLLADIKAGVTSANDFTVNLVPGGVMISPGIVETFGTFNNPVDVTRLEADFTQNADDATAISDENGVTLLDFTVNSNGTQSLNSTLTFTFSTDVTNILENFDLQVGGVNIGGAETYPLTVGGTTLTVTGFTSVDVTNATTFTLLADIKAVATVANDFTINLAPGGVSISPGSVEAFVIFSNAVDITTSQLSNIILNGGTTDNIDYINTRIGNPLTSGNSASLATFRIQDGGGAADADNASTTLTVLEILLSNTAAAKVRRIALFDDGGSLIAGTQQDVSGTTITWTGLSIVATDATGFKDFSVRATFISSPITDNTIVDVTIQSATASVSGSGFAAVDAGAASSTTAAGVDANRIEVGPGGLSLVFAANPPNTPINTNFSLTVQARDAQSNVDEDYTRQVALTEDGPGALSVSGGQSLTPFLVAGVYNWTTLQANQSGTYNLVASDNPYDDAFADATGTVNITSSSGTVSQPPALNLCFGGSFQTLGNIQITETDLSGFSNTGSFSIALPTGFVFDTGGSPPTLAMSNSTTTFSAQSFTGGNIFQFDYSIASPTGLNTLTIGNLRIRYPGSTAPSGGNQITRSGGTASIAGVGPGTQLGTVNATLGTPPIGGVTFTVAKVNPGDVDVAATETRFSQTSAPVRLIGSQATGVFSGPGVTFTSGQYRFNPSSLSPGTYPIVYTFTDATAGACQFTAQKTFEVYLTSISGLALQYCNNSPASGVLSVSPATLSSICVGCVVYKYIYYYPGGGGALFLPGSNPAGTVFDPKNSTFTNVYTATLASYGTYGIWLGFIASPDGGATQYYNYAGLIPVKLAPIPTFTIPDADRKFCNDDPSVVLTGTPPNGNIVTDDYFTALVYPFTPTDIAPVGTVSATISTPKVWSFDPGTLGVDSARITYTYRDPVTTCTATSPFLKVTVSSRPGTVLAAAITSLGGTAPETCQGAPISTFTATPLAAPNRYTWYSNAALTTGVGTGNSFTPPNPPVNPNIPTPAGSPHTFYVTQTINGCESNAALPLTVTVKPAPPAPTPNFLDAGREFCVGATVTLSTLVVPGTNVRWFAPGTTTPVLFSGTNPTLASLGIPNPTVAAAVYNYEVTQTVSLCESPRTPVRVTIKALPKLTIIADTDTTKICTTGSLITFKGRDGGVDVTTGNWTTVGPGFTPGALIPLGGEARLIPATVAPGNYVLRFVHQNSALCSSSKTIQLRVLPKILPSLATLDVCEEIHSQLVNTSKYVTGNTSSADTTAVNTPVNTATTAWDFNDGLTLTAGTPGTVNVPVGTNGGLTKGTYLNPEHVFQVLGSRSVEYTMKTIDGCTYVGTTNVTVNNKPNINFTWRNPCFDALAGYSSTRFTASEATSIPIAQYYWNFGINGNLNHSGTPGGGAPTVNYIDIGTDSVELIVRTAANCRDTIQKIVYVLPIYKAITDTSGYDQNFNAGNNFWIQGGFRSSWLLGNTMTGASASNGAAWATGLTGPNNNGERSWVMSGCFDFSDAAKPVVSMDVWSDTPFGVDGAVFQYNDDGKIENEGSWNVLGFPTSGINWYDGSGISNSPGNQTANDFGWTGTYSDWKKAIYKLDVAGGDTVVFRVAFAGGNRQQSGFAFDNVFIGERSRVVLLESFTNTNPTVPADTIAINAHNKEYERFGDVAGGEIVKVQYHTPFPGTDVLNGENQQMNNSRAAFYGITEAPAGRVDGGYENGALPNWLDEYNDDRVLSPSIIRLDSTGAKKSGTDVKIGVTLQNTSSQALPLAGLNLFVVIVQKEILKSTDPALFGQIDNLKFVYVARQMLPSAAGTQLSGILAGGQSLALDSITWSHPNGGDAIVVFLQKIDSENKPVLQAFLLENPPTPNVITDTEDPEYAKYIYLYPNPANNEVNIELPSAVSKPTPVALSDAYGRIVYQADFKAGEKTIRVPTSALANGIYMMQILTPQGNKVLKKVMVKH